RQRPVRVARPALGLVEHRLDLGRPRLAGGELARREIEVHRQHAGTLGRAQRRQGPQPLGGDLVDRPRHHTGTPPRTSARAAEAIASASMPASASSSAGLPDPGMSRTPSLTTGGRSSASAKAPSTASPSPPSGHWSSATTTRSPAAAAASRSPPTAIGLSEQQSST